MSVKPLVSILIPCVADLKFTKLCVASVLKCTRPEFEFIFVDNDSTDGTVAFLSEIQATANVRVEIVLKEPETRIGKAFQPYAAIKAACRRAVAEAGGEYLLALSNDTVVAHGWLDQLEALLNMDAKMGVVGAMSNLAHPPQLVESVPYHWDELGNIDIEAMEAFTQAFRAEHRGKWMQTVNLGGACQMMRREVWNRVADTINDDPGVILYDNRRLCVDVTNAGYNLGCCRDLFIHRFQIYSSSEERVRPSNN